MESQLIAHRRNTIEELDATPPEYGVEMDIRSYGDRLIVHHEPFIDAVNFEEWIKYYRHKTLILNIKEEGIEYRVKRIVEQHGIENYFFLDLSFPFLLKMVNANEKRVAVRLSEFEPVETALQLSGRASWVWVDCFSRLPMDDKMYEKLKRAGFKLCLVSPELQQRPEELLSYKNIILKKGWKFDAVCTKHPDAWDLNDV